MASQSGAIAGTFAVCLIALAGAFSQFGSPVKSSNSGKPARIEVRKENEVLADYQHPVLARVVKSEPRNYIYERTSSQEKSECGKNGIFRARKTTETNNSKRETYTYPETGYVYERQHKEKNETDRYKGPFKRWNNSSKHEYVREGPVMPKMSASPELIPTPAPLEDRASE